MTVSETYQLELEIKALKDTIEDLRKELENNYKISAKQFQKLENIDKWAKDRGLELKEILKESN